MALEITIDQNEIETAIKNHIGTLLTVAEGQSISISMKAGRGDNGFSATIEIGGNGTPKAEAPTTEAPKDKPVVTGPFKRNPKPAATPTTETAQSDAQADAGAVTEEDTTSTTEGQDDGIATASADVGVEAGEPQPEGEAAPKKGLFAHLGKRTGTEAAE